MPRVYLPLLPVPVLALIVAFSACSRSGEPVTHVIPPAAPYQQSTAVAAAPAPSLASAATAAQTAGTPAPLADGDAPSDEEVEAFERAVPK